MFGSIRDQLANSLSELNKAVTVAIVTWLREALDDEFDRYFKSKGLTIETLYDLQAQLNDLSFTIAKSSKITKRHEKTLLYVRMGIDDFNDRLEIAESDIGNMKRINFLRDKIKSVDKAFKKTEKVFKLFQGARQ